MPFFVISPGLERNFIEPMSSVLNYRECIISRDVSRHTVRKEHLSHKWELLCECNEVNRVIESITEGKSVSVSRGQIFQTLEAYDKVIKALWWGYPNGMRVNLYFNNIVAAADEVSACLNQYKGKDILEADYLQLYREVKGIVGRGMGMSTISKLFYFFNISVEGCMSVIVDNRVKARIQHFDDFNPIHTADEAMWYLTAVREINRVAGDWAEPDQIEYFLFGFQ